MQIVLIVTGAILYLGLAVLIGRFLSLSTKGDIQFPLNSQNRDPGFYEPETTVNMPVRAFENEKSTDASRAKSEKPMETISS